MNILFIGDIVGRRGRECVAQRVRDLAREHSADLVIANGENVAAGKGLTTKTAQFLLDAGIDVLTSGNHIWAQKEVYEFLGTEPRVLRPANYPPGAPGRGWGVFTTRSGAEVAILNLMGRVFMDPLDCPFRAADAILDELPPVAAILVDFHAEATSEKQALGRYLDGRVTAVLGTHTHVQTADDCVLPGGTAYLTDVGMTGPRESIIGIKLENGLERFLTGLPVKFEIPGEGPCILSGAVVKCNGDNGHADSIYRLQEHSTLD